MPIRTSTPTRHGSLHAQHVRVYALPEDGSSPKGPLDPTEATDVAFAEPTYSLGGGAPTACARASLRD